MPTNTARLAVPIPTQTDSADVPAVLTAIFAKLDPELALFSQGTFSAKPSSGMVVGQFYWATDLGTLYLYNGGAWVLAAPAPPMLVTSLPSSPVDGQVIYYQNGLMQGLGIVWPLRYRSSSPSSHKWEPLGAVPLVAVDTAGYAVYVTAPSTWSLPTNNQPAVVTPLSGDYVVETQVYVTNVTTACDAILGATVNNSLAAPSYVGQTRLAINQGASLSVFSPISALQSQNIGMLLWNNNPTPVNCGFSQRLLTIRPIRLG